MTIPARFRPGSDDPARAYTVDELRELLAELPGEIPLTLRHDSGSAVELIVVDGELELGAFNESLVEELGGES